MGSVGKGWHAGAGKSLITPSRGEGALTPLIIFRKTCGCTLTVTFYATVIILSLANILCNHASGFNRVVAMRAVAQIFQERERKRKTLFEKIINITRNLSQI